MEISTIVAGLAFIVGIAGWLKASQTRGLLKKTNQEMECRTIHVEFYQLFQYGALGGPKLL